MTTRSDRLRIGLVGCGLIGRFHARSLQQVADRAELAFVFDIDRDRAIAFAADFDTSVAGTLEQLIRDVDAVYVCTWTAAHAEIVQRALDAGRRGLLRETPGARSRSSRQPRRSDDGQ